MWVTHIVLLQVDGLIPGHFPLYRFIVKADAVLHLYIHVNERHILPLWMEDGRVPHTQWTMQHGSC